MRIYPPVAAGLYLLAAWALGYFLPNLEIINSPYHLTGIIILVAGFWLLLWPAWLFNKQSTTHNPYGLPTKLVTGGPYRFTRNPMYLGQLMIILGIAVLLQGLFFFLGVLAFGLTINIFFIPQEEKKLEQIFGRDYVDYKKRVRRWL